RPQPAGGDVVHHLGQATLVHAGGGLALAKHRVHLLADLGEDLAHGLALQRVHEARPPNHAGHCQLERRSAPVGRGSSICPPYRRWASSTSDFASGERRSTRTTGRLRSTARQHASGSNGSTALSGSPNANSYSQREKSRRERCWFTTMP